MRVTFRADDEGEVGKSSPVATGVAAFLSDLNHQLRSSRPRLVGEVTSLKNSYATAIYFTIKDLEADALLNCVVWRSTYDKNGITLKEGDQIIVTGTPEIYAPRGSFSLKVETLEYAGVGQLKAAYDALRAKLTAEGLLAVDRKRALPLYPKRIGVITSQAGVVIQDFSANLGRYGFEVLMADARVEGKDAIHDILAALRKLATQPIEVLVIMRGGGSLESLQAFNTEAVVRAIAAFPVPVVTGIGHDVDVTLAELVADVPASTPTAVAEVLNESWDTLQSSLATFESCILHAYQRSLTDVHRTLDQEQVTIIRRFDQLLTMTRRALDQSTSRVRNAYRLIERTVTGANAAFQAVMTRLWSELKARQLVIEREQLSLIGSCAELVRGAQRTLIEQSRYLVIEEGRAIQRISERLTNIEQQISSHDPARQLQLGYSLSYVEGKLIRSVHDLSVGAVVEVRVGDGSFTGEVKSVQ
jgi:exodeoxyribonuclease VII large subunit